MSAKKHVVRLLSEERVALTKLSQCERRSIREKMRARILLRSDLNTSREDGGSQRDEEIAKSLKTSSLTIANVRKRAQERGALASIPRQVQKTRAPRRLDGQQEAHLVAITCSTPPLGAAKWSLRLVRERLLELEVIESIGLETIRQTLKKTRSNPG